MPASRVKTKTQGNPKTIITPLAVPPNIEAAWNRHRAASQQRLSPAVTGEWEDNRAAGLYKGSGDPVDQQDPCLIPAAVAYKDLIAKSGTSTLSPTIQQDFSGGKQLTLAREILRTRLAPGQELQKTDRHSKPHDVRQVSFEGGQVPMATCGSYAVVSECESGHHFAKRLYCGREWCEVCGEEKSAAHKRRMARLIPKLQQCHEIGYFVIEFPDAYRYVGEAGISPDMVEDEGQGWCYSKNDLRQTTSTIIEVIAGRRSAGGRGSKRVKGYFARGIARWHYFGDKKPGKWNPHLNVIVDSGSLYDKVRNDLQPEIEAYRASLAAGKQTKKVKRELQGIDMYHKGKSGYLPKPILDYIKAELRLALNCPELIVHFEKRDTPGKIVHCVRYITRATFRHYAWNEYMAQELYDFRNIRWWGSWKGESVWQLRQAEVEGEDILGLEAVERLQAGLCPDCGSSLKVWHHSHTGKSVKWSKPVDSTYLLIWSAREIAGTGYYRIPWQNRSSTVFSPGEILRLQELEARARDKPSVHPFAVAMRQSIDVLWRATNTYKAMMRHKLEQEVDDEVDDEAEYDLE